MKTFNPVHKHKMTQINVIFHCFFKS